MERKEHGNGYEDSESDSENDFEPEDGLEVLDLIISLGFVTPEEAFRPEPESERPRREGIQRRRRRREEIEERRRRRSDEREANFADDEGEFVDIDS
jgi:epoxyqueuosine reductase QueG